MTRGDGDPSKPGSAQLTVESAHQVQDGDAAYTVRAEARLSDAEHELIAELKVSYLCSYDVNGEPPTEEQLETFARSVVIQATPFIREFLANTTTRMGIAPFLMPLVRHSDVGPPTKKAKTTAAAGSKKPAKKAASSGGNR